MMHDVNIDISHNNNHNIKYNIKPLYELYQDFISDNDLIIMNKKFTRYAAN